MVHIQKKEWPAHKQNACYISKFINKNVYKRCEDGIIMLVIILQNSVYWYKNLSGSTMLRFDTFLL